jgi:uncharacterized metal-binding protein YceD (DUF177 family)
MKHNREFNIAYVGLKPGMHQFSYLIEDSFFEDIVDIDFTDTSIKVLLNLDKKTNLMVLDFVLDGMVQLPCDRCNEPLDLRIFDEYKLYVKLVDGEISDAQESEDADIVYFPRSESLMSIKDWLYEYIILSMPIQRVHGEDDNGNSLCNPAVIALLDQHQQQILETKQQSETNTALADQLNKLKIKKDAKS